MKKALIALMLCSLSLPVFAKDIFVPRKPAHTVLRNGLEIYFIEDRELPVVDLMFYVRGGSVYDPVGKEGLSSVTMQSLRLGGTLSLSPDDVEEALEQVAGTLEMGSQPEYFSGTLSILRKDTDLGLDLLFSLLRTPRFEEDRFRLVKAHAIEALERETEDPFVYANKEFSKMIYQNDLKPLQPTNAWGRFPTERSLQSLSWDDVKAHYRKMIAPDRLIIAVAGNIGFQELVSKIETRTQGWARSSSPLSPIHPVKPEGMPRVKTLTRPGLTQSTIFVGHLGTSRDNPDKFALQVMNFLLGGGGALNSRMGEEIRSNAGKAYVVYSDFGFGKDRGVFRLMAQTALENTEWVVDKMRTMVTDFSRGTKNGLATREEVERAKRGPLRSLIFDFETSFAQVKEQARFALLGYPDDYIEIFQRKIHTLSVSEINHVAQKYLKPDAISTLILTAKPPSSLKAQENPRKPKSVKNK